MNTDPKSVPDAVVAILAAAARVEDSHARWRATGDPEHLIRVLAHLEVVHEARKAALAMVLAERRFYAQAGAELRDLIKGAADGDL